jgi:Fic family protein
MLESLDKLSDQLNLSHEVLNLIAEIDEFKGKWEVLSSLSPERLSALQSVATIESVGSSTRIEGVKLTDREVETLLTNLKTYSFKSRDEEEVAGYAEVMKIIFESWQELDFTENHIKQLHSILLKFSTKDVSHRGKYKTLSNNVVAFDKDGKEIGVVFATCSPFQTPFEMVKLVGWLNRETTIHPLLKTAVFVVCFLAAHPFQDGNGRLSRILTTLLLIKFGYKYVPFASLESVIEDNKDLYYNALRKTQKTLTENKPDWQTWVLFFLRCLKKQKDRLSKNLEREKLLLVKLPKLSGEILALVREHERLTISDLETFTQANRNTLKVRLRELVSDGFLSQSGKARATWYSLQTVNSFVL